MDNTPKPQVAIMLEDKWTVEQGRVILTGTQALVKVMLSQKAMDTRSGFNTAGYITGYRGSPLGTVDMTLWPISDYLKASDILFQPGLNEDIAVTACAGTQQIDQIAGAKYDGVFAAWYGKGPGVDRSGDAFKHGNYAGSHPRGGVVIFYGDDHAGKSSTVAYQSEQAMAANLVPSFYPADAGEILEYGLFAIALSRYCGSWAAVKCETEVVGQTTTVDIDLLNFSPVLPPINTTPPEGLHAAIKPFNPLRAEQVVTEYRLPLIKKFVRANGIDHAYFRAKQPNLGLVSAGKSFGSVMEALHLLGLDVKTAAEHGISLYKVGCIWPLDDQGILEFALGQKILFVMEEKKSFIEQQIATYLVNEKNAPTLIGKKDERGQSLLSETQPLDPVDLAREIAKRLDVPGLPNTDIRDRLASLPEAPIPSNSSLPKRDPFFCSGCPHNRSTRIPEGSISLTGIGCHAMVNFVRPEEALISTQMGGEGANWIGLAPFTNTRHIFQNMGDGTYYHSGLLAIRAAIAAKVNITYKILYNDAVAMTGGQPVDGPISVVEIAQQVAHEGVKHITIVSDTPSNYNYTDDLPPGTRIKHRDALDQIQREMRKIPGCTVLIYEQTCAAEKRRKRKHGNFPNPMKRAYIVASVCESCGDCSVQSTCVSIIPQPTVLGIKRKIDQSSCNKDYSCMDGFCPSFLTIHNAEPRKPDPVSLDGSLFTDLPFPNIAPIKNNSFNIIIAGIGGTGVITIGALLGMAAHIEDKTVSLFDITGVAQKNGAVYSHIKIANSPDTLHTKRLGRQKADILLAFDMVAALAPECADTLSKERTVSVVNLGVSVTSTFQFDRDFTIEPEILLSKLQLQVGDDTIISLDAGDLALRIFGDTIAANLFMLGIACQSGLLPIGPPAIEEAIRLNKVAVTMNHNAFRLGRFWAYDTRRVEAMVPEPQKNQETLPQNLSALVKHRSALLNVYQGAALAVRYNKLVDRVIDAESRIRSNSNELARAVAHNYARVLAYKDEYEVARLLSDPMLLQDLRREFADGAAFSVNLAPKFFASSQKNGRPGKRPFSLKFVTPFLRILARLRFLRGTPFDLFGYQEDRKDERALIAEYEELVIRTVDSLKDNNLDQAILLLSLANEVRGFGPIKKQALKTYHTKIVELETDFQAI